jgi:hypothetical protein
MISMTLEVRKKIVIIYLDKGFRNWKKGAKELNKQTYLKTKIMNIQIDRRSLYATPVDILYAGRRCSCWIDDDDARCTMRPPRSILRYIKYKIRSGSLRTTTNHDWFSKKHFKLFIFPENFKMREDGHRQHRHEQV